MTTEECSPPCRTKTQEREFSRYLDYISRLPSPGGGGAHRAIFAAGCLGSKAGLAQDSVFQDLRSCMPAGTRMVSDREIRDGVAAGFATSGGNATPHPSRPSPAIAPGTFDRLVREGAGATEEDISRLSPVPVNLPAHEAAALVLGALYKEEEPLFIGDDKFPGVPGRTVRPAGEWAKIFQFNRIVAWPKIIPNPLTGKPSPKKSGAGMTYRGDGCVSAYRFAVLEMDSVPIEDQLAFWAAAKLPLAALIHSGGKSLHGWVRVDCESAEEWEREIRGRMFPAYWVPLGFDAACSNAARLSRTPGHLRADSQQIQRLLYLAPSGRQVTV